jgi:lysophospholipid acyltransferase (LPLAT)-like uncharacterized protein
MRRRFPPALLAAAGDLLFRITAGTARVEVIGGDQVESARRAAPGLIFSLWHGRLLLGARAHRDRRTAIMISRHEDGEVIAKIVERHGYIPVRGSTSRGGATALREMIDLARGGVKELAFTPDGPRGPLHRVQPGVVHLASATGYWIVPSSASARPGRFLGSWDRFLVPWPFARMVVAYGAPIEVAPGLDEAGLRQVADELQKAMIDVEAEADRRTGW